MAILKSNPISGFADEISSDLQVQLDLIRKLGMQWLEFRSVGGVNVAELTMPQIQGIRQTLDTYGLRVSAVASPLGKIRLEEDFQAHLRKMEHILDISDVLGTDSIRVFSFFLPRGEDPANCSDAVMYRMDSMAELAQKRGKLLLHENEKGIYGDSALRCLQLCQRFGGSHFAAIFDFANFVECGQDTLEAYEMLQPHIRYVHIKDAVGATRQVVLPGEGDGKLAQILEKLDTEGYEGFLSLEPHLVDFAGLQSLEQNAAAVRGRTDGENAFAEAHNTLLQILGR